MRTLLALLLMTGVCCADELVGAGDDWQHKLPLNHGGYEYRTLNFLEDISINLWTTQATNYVFRYINHELLKVTTGDNSQPIDIDKFNVELSCPDGYALLVTVKNRSNQECYENLHGKRYVDICNFVTDAQARCIKQ